MNSIHLQGALGALVLAGLSACAAAPEAKQAAVEDCVRGEAPLGSSIPRKSACIKVSADEAEAARERLSRRPIGNAAEPGAR